MRLATLVNLVVLLWQLHSGPVYHRGIVAVDASELEPTRASGEDCPSHSRVPGRHCLGEDRTRRKTKHVLFLSVPVSRHADPLFEIARQLAGSSSLRVSFAFPRWFGPMLLEGYEQGQDYSFVPGTSDAVTLVPLDGVVNFGVNDSSSTRVNGGLSQAELQEMYEKPMTMSLLESISDAGSYFDMVVSDRYTFAGYNVADKFGVPLAVFNPWTLLDIDNPPGYVVCPMSGKAPSDIGLDVFSRLHNMWERFKLVIREQKLSQQSLINVRSEIGLGRLRLRPDYCTPRLVLSGTLLGWLDEARPLAPLQHAVGPILPSWALRAIESSKMKRSEPRQEDGGLVLVQGIYSASAKSSWKAALASIGMSPRFIGERCTAESILARCGQRQSRAMLITHGDLACVALAALCPGLGPLVVCPLLPEHVEVASFVRANGLGAAVTKPQGLGQALAELAQHKKGNDVKILRAMGNSMRLAGGAVQAAHLLETWLLLGSTSSRLLPAECAMPWYERALLDVYLACGFVVFLLGFFFKHLLALAFAVLDLEEEDYVSSASSAAVQSKKSKHKTTRSSDSSNSSSSNSARSNQDLFRASPQPKKRAFSYERAVQDA